MQLQSERKDERIERYFGEGKGVRKDGKSKAGEKKRKGEK